jgi:crotonobetainyl-CoA:carnitine CoA-transferase CaiB-like acyl-CoA transferase
MLGEHTWDSLQELGYDDQEIQELIDEKGSFLLKGQQKQP